MLVLGNNNKIFIRSQEKGTSSIKDEVIGNKHLVCMVVKDGEISSWKRAYQFRA